MTKEMNILKSHLNQRSNLSQDRLSL